MAVRLIASLQLHGRRLHGRRGLKLPSGAVSVCARRRRLHGRRGLKYYGRHPCDRIYTSPPSRAAWIEIVSRVITTPYAKSLPSRAAWIEMVAVSSLIVRFSSPPSRAAWIEILHTAAASRLRARRRLHGRRGFKFSSTLQKHLTYRHCIRRWYVCSASPV